MQQLTGIDATFLNMETATTFGHVNSLAIFDPSTAPAGHYTYDDVKDLIEQRLHLLPMFRRRVVEVPFGIDHPYWVEDPCFDIDFHVREIGLPPPGDKYQLAEQVARIAARPLDRSRPLWELYVIEGLEDGHIANMTKIHHAAIDGVSGQEMLATLLDTTPEPRDVPPPDRPWRPEPIPGQLQMLGRGLSNLTLQPWKAMRLQRQVLQNLPGISRVMTDFLTGRGFRREGEVLSRPALTAPRTPFNRSITPHRRWAFASLPIDDVKAVKNAFGMTLNDVVMAMCASALRRWLIEHGELPREPLLAMVPISVRTTEETGAFGNRVSAMVASLHTDIADPVERLRLIHRSMNVAKEQHRAVPASLLQDFGQFATPSIAALAARLVARTRIVDRINPPFNVVISNVPGPNYPLYLAGARMVANYPVSTIADGGGLNMTVQSYMGHLDFGLISCRELVPDIWSLMDYVEEGLDELKAAAKGEGSAPSAATEESGEPDEDASGGDGQSEVRATRRRTSAARGRGNS